MVTQEFAECKGSYIVATGNSLSTGMDMDCKVLDAVESTGAYLHLLPGTEHEVHLRLEEA